MTMEITMQIYIMVTSNSLNSVTFSVYVRKSKRQKFSLWNRMKVVFFHSLFHESAAWRAWCDISPKVSRAKSSGSGSDNNKSADSLRKTKHQTQMKLEICFSLQFLLIHKWTLSHAEALLETNNQGSHQLYNTLQNNRDLNLNLKIKYHSVQNDS